MKPESAPPAGQPPDEREALSAEERALAERLATLRDLRFSEEQRRRGAALLQERIATEGKPPVAAAAAAALPPVRSRGSLRTRPWLQPALRLGLALGAVVFALLGVGYVAAQSLPGLGVAAPLRLANRPDSHAEGAGPHGDRGAHEGAGRRVDDRDLVGAR